MAKRNCCQEKTKVQTVDCLRAIMDQNSPQSMGGISASCYGALGGVKTAENYEQSLYLSRVQAGDLDTWMQKHKHKYKSVELYLFRLHGCLSLTRHQTPLVSHQTLDTSKVNFIMKQGVNEGVQFQSSANTLYSLLGKHPLQKFAGEGLSLQACKHMGVYLGREKCLCLCREANTLECNWEQIFPPVACLVVLVLLPAEHFLSGCEVFKSGA